MTTAPIFEEIQAAIDDHGGSTPGLADRIKAIVRDRFDNAGKPPLLGMTETDAAMRWCPHVREVTPVGKSKKDAAIGNRYLDKDSVDYANPAGCRCIASHCAAWRWLDPFRGCCGLAGPVIFQPPGEPRRLVNRTPLPRPTSTEQQDLFPDE
jgi:hypothetical protein